MCHYKLKTKTLKSKANNGKQATTHNHTGIPSPIKEGFELSSGFSFDDVRVHYNSQKPAQLYALAYTQGNQVYIGPGSEQHLVHELAHVVQQKQGMVPSTGSINGLSVNTNPALEQQADLAAYGIPNRSVVQDAKVPSPVIQMRLPSITALVLQRLFQEFRRRGWDRDGSDSNEVYVNKTIHAHRSSIPELGLAPSLINQLLRPLRESPYSIITSYYSHNASLIGEDRGLLDPRTSGDLIYGRSNSRRAIYAEVIPMLSRVLLFRLLGSRRMLTDAIRVGNAEYMTPSPYQRDGMRTDFPGPHVFGIHWKSDPRCSKKYYSQIPIQSGARQFGRMIDRDLPDISVGSIPIGGITRGRNIDFGLAAGRSQAVHEYGHHLENQLSPNDFATLHNFLRARTSRLRREASIGFNFFNMHPDAAAYDAELPPMDFVNFATRWLTMLPASRRIAPSQPIIGSLAERVLEKTRIGALARAVPHAYNTLNFSVANTLRYGASLPFRGLAHLLRIGVDAGIGIPRRWPMAVEGFGQRLTDNYFLQESNREATHYATAFDSPETGRTEFLSTTAELLSTEQGARKLIGSDPLRVALFLYLANRPEYERVKNVFKHSTQGVAAPNLDSMIHAFR